MTYIGKHDDESESSDEDLSDEKIVALFRLLITKWEEACIKIERQKKIISVLHQDKKQLPTIITCLKEEIPVLTSKIEDTIKTCEILNKGSNMLDEIVEDAKKLRLTTRAKFCQKKYR